MAGSTAPHILVVDDDLELCQVIVDTLTNNGYNAVYVQTAEEGYATAVANPPDLILSDLEVPVMGGFVFCQKLHANPTTKLVPFIFITVRDSSFDKQTAMSLGANHYMTKPFRRSQLLAQVKKLLDANGGADWIGPSASHLKKMEQEKVEQVSETPIIEDGNQNPLEGLEEMRKSILEGGASAEEAAAAETETVAETETETAAEISETEEVAVEPILEPVVEEPSNSSDLLSELEQDKLEALQQSPAAPTKSETEKMDDGAQDDDSKDGETQNGGPKDSGSKPENVSAPLERKSTHVGRPPIKNMRVGEKVSVPTPAPRKEIFPTEKPGTDAVKPVGTKPGGTFVPSNNPPKNLAQNPLKNPAAVPPKTVPAANPLLNKKPVVPGAPTGATTGIPMGTAAAKPPLMPNAAAPKLPPAKGAIPAKNNLSPAASMPKMGAPKMPVNPMKIPGKPAGPLAAPVAAKPVSVSLQAGNFFKKIEEFKVSVIAHKWLALGIAVTVFGVSAWGGYKAYSNYKAKIDLLKKNNLAAAMDIVSVNVLEVNAAPFQDVLTAVGTIAGGSEVELRFQTEGNVQRLNFKEGDSVQSGQVIAQLDQSQTAIKLERAKAEFFRYEKLYALGGVSKERVDEARTQYEYAQSELNKTVLRASQSGIFGDKGVEVGEFVTSQKKVGTLVSLNSVLVRIGVIEKEIDKIFPGQVVTATVDTYPNVEFKGKVENISPLVQGQSKTLTVEARIPNTNKMLLPGMFARARIAIYELPSAIAIPNDALEKTPEGNVVYVVGAGSKAEARHVEVEYVSLTHAVIKSGLQPGDQVIVQRPQELKEGVAVKVIDVEKGGGVLGAAGAAGAGVNGPSSGTGSGSGDSEDGGNTP